MLIAQTYEQSKGLEKLYWNAVWSFIVTVLLVYWLFSLFYGVIRGKQINVSSLVPVTREENVKMTVNRKKYTCDDRMDADRWDVLRSPESTSVLVTGNNKFRTDRRGGIWCWRPRLTLGHCATELVFTIMYLLWWLNAI